MKGLVTLVPAPGATIRDPRTGRMISGPMTVKLDSFWHRRLQDGSMTLAPEASFSRGKSPAPAKPRGRGFTPDLVPEV
jgi:hypothetical protein